VLIECVECVPVECFECGECTGLFVEVCVTHLT